MQYQDFELQLDATAQGELRARVLRSPFGEGGTTFSLPFSSEEASAALAPRGIVFASAGPVLVRGAAEAAAGPPVPPRPPLEVGTELYRSLFRGQVRTLFDKSRGQLQLEPDRCLRVKIKLDPNDPAMAALADLPWELLHDEEVDDRFALSRQTTLIRYLDVPRPSHPIPFTPPLRILAVAASPSGLPPLNLDEECSRLEELERREPGVEVRFLRNASAGAVREVLADGGFHVLHFMGHGDFDGISGEGLLFFEQPDGSAERVSGRTFATRLRDLRSLGLVTLNACNTGRALHRLGTSPFRGVATALVLGGLPAVVAMQHPISDVAAIGFSSAFYRHLGRGLAIDAALTEGRQAILSASPDGCEWAIPVLFLRVADGNVFVARPAAEAPPAPPAPAAAPAPLSPAPVPPVEISEPARAAGTVLPIAPSDRKTGWPLPKVAGAAGGAVVLVLGIYSGIQGLKSGEPKSSIVAPEPTTDVNSVDDANPNKRKERGRDSLGKPELSKPPTGPESIKKEPPVTVAEPPGGGTSTTPSGDSTVPTAPAPTASSDVSLLRANVVSLAKREEGGLRVTLSFSNTSSSPLSVIVSEEGTMLSGEGQRYGPLDSDLPSVESGFRLTLSAGASARHTLDFQAPKLGSKKFVLSLATIDGQRIRVDAATQTLAETP